MVRPDPSDQTVAGPPGGRGRWLPGRAGAEDPGAQRAHQVGARGSGAKALRGWENVGVGHQMWETLQELVDGFWKGFDGKGHGFLMSLADVR